MIAPFRCKYCGGPVNAKANGRPLPCPELTCPCDIGIDPYAHVYRVPEQDGDPLIPGFSKPNLFGFDVKVSEHMPEDTIIITDGALGRPIGMILSPDGTPAPEHVKNEAPIVGWYATQEISMSAKDITVKAGPVVGWYATEQIGSLGAVLDPNLPRLEHAQRLLNDLHESGDMDNMHIEGCPEDNTCRCPRVQTMNLVMHGWQPPKVTHTGVHCAPEAATEARDQTCRRCGTAINGEFCTDKSCPFSEHARQCQRGWIGHPESATDESTPCTCAMRGTYTLRPSPDLHRELAPTKVATTGQAAGKSSAQARPGLAKLYTILASEGDAGLCYVDPDELRAIIDMLEAEVPAVATVAPPRLVVCAASRRAETDHIVIGARHYDARMREQMERAGGLVKWRGCEQGFIDQRGAFMTREEAWKVAEAAGQIRRRCGGDTASGGTLFSENLC